jgi:predicted Zn finger-like uncharacterized protein
MPEFISCPDCQRKLRVPDDLLGKKVKCPRCNVMFTATSASRDAVVTRDYYDDARQRRRDDDDYDQPRPRRRREDDYDDDYDRPRRRRDDDYEEDYQDSPRRRRAGWKRVCTGLNVYSIGIWIWCGGLLLFSLGVAIAMLLGPSNGGDVVAGVLSVLFLFAALADLILRTVGAGLCMGIPSKIGTARKPLAITAFSLYAAHAGILLITFLVIILDAGFTTFGDPFRMIRGATAMLIISSLLGLAALMVFLLANRSAAIGIRARSLGGTFMALLITFVSCGVASFLLNVIVSGIGNKVTSPSGAQAFLVISIIFLILELGCYLGLEIWYAFSLQQLRATIQYNRAEQ